MKLKKGYNNGLYIVFDSEDSAMKWEWLFYNIFKFSWSCYGQYMNAFCIIDKENR